MWIFNTLDNQLVDHIIFYDNWHRKSATIDAKAASNRLLSKDQIT